MFAGSGKRDAMLRSHHADFAPIWELNAHTESQQLETGL
jgi:hypothetical protein